VPLGYLGVDVVIDVELGPLVLEINARPGLEIQNINGAGLGPAVASAGGLS
jgi:predicted ATP-grasp superfamily ATP-dependent carboligase